MVKSTKRWASFKMMCLQSDLIFWNGTKKGGRQININFSSVFCKRKWKILKLLCASAFSKRFPLKVIKMWESKKHFLQIQRMRPTNIIQVSVWAKRKCECFVMAASQKCTALQLRFGFEIRSSLVHFISMGNVVNSLAGNKVFKHPLAGIIFGLMQIQWRFQILGNVRDIFFPVWLHRRKVIPKKCVCLFIETPSLFK